MGQVRRRYRKIRSAFKSDIYKACKDNRAFAMMIVSTYAASQHRTHITKIWSLLRNHPEAHKDYTDNLFGKHLTGRDDIMRSLYFADKELYQKYFCKIPECYAMGDALAVAYKVLRERNE